MITRFIIALPALVISTAAFAENVNCPETIEVAAQTLAKDVPGWRSFFDKVNNHYALESISLYSGEPEQLASLVPDAGSDAYSEWKLLDNGKQKYFLTCSYSNTSVQLTRELPANLSKCRVTFEKDVYNVNGTPVPLLVTCS